MFDGNHRVRRTQNLGGGSGSRSRRSRLAGGTASRSGVGVGVGGGTGTGTLGSHSLTAVPDRKSQLLEQARIQREQRREVARRNGAARELQRVCRGWKCRLVLVDDLGRRYDDLLRRAATTATAGGSGSDSTAVAELASVLSAFLSPPLLPLVSRQRRGGGKTDSMAQRQGTVLTLVQRFGNVISQGCANFSIEPLPILPLGGDGIGDSSIDSDRGSGTKPIDAIAAAAERTARHAYVCGRIVRRSLAALQYLCNASSAGSSSSKLSASSSLSSSSPPSGNDDVEFNSSSSNKAAVQLVELIATLLGTRGGDTDAAVMAKVLCNSSVSEEGYGPMVLFLCFRDWFELATSSSPSSSLSRPSTLDGEVVVKVTGSLLRLSTRAASLLSSQQQKGEGIDAKSILAAALFASPRREGVNDEWSAEIDRFIGGSTGLTALEAGDGSYIALMTSLVHALVDSFDGTTTVPGTAPKPTTSDGASSNSVRDVVQAMVLGKEITLLTNVLDRLVPYTGSVDRLDSSISTLLVHLLHFILDKRRDLAIVASLSARGENVRATLLNSGSDIVDLTADGDVGDAGDMSTSSDSDDDMDVDDVPGSQQQHQDHRLQQQGVSHLSRAIGPATTVRPGYKRTKTSRFSRQDLQTTGKLDRLYHTEVGNARKEVLLKLKEASRMFDVEQLVDLADRIGGGPLMSTLGSSLFREGAPTSSAHKSSILIYTMVLSNLLESVTGSKTRSSASSPLLSRLSFNPEFLGELWRHVKATSAGGIGLCTDRNSVASAAALATFCDLYSHQLLAVDDGEFLRNYTTVNDSSGTASRAIIAEQVIIHVRRCLYETYWSRPVTRRDVNVPSRISPSEHNSEMLFNCHRLRFLLSGTKLWNSLHERWCRLSRSSPFCEEKTWWFPKLVSKGRDDDAVMVGGISSSALAAHHQDDDMSDSGSDASPMDIDTASLEGNEDSNAASQEPTAAEEENDALASTFSDPKMARVLTAIPQALPFDRRVHMFSSLLYADKARTQDETRALHQAAMRAMDDDGEWNFSGREQAEIRRDRLYEDSMNQLNRLGRRLRRRVQITMINKHGQQEAGIDGGGVFKEFLDDLIKEAFDPQAEEGINNAASSRSPLFTVTPTQTLAVNIDAGRDQETLAHYEFLGRVLGKAVYESILVETQFCLPFLNQLLCKQNTLDDLKNLDPEYYRHINGLKNMSAAEIAGLGLTFELTRGNQNQMTIELMPGGSSVPVTKENAIRYVHLVAHRKLNLDSAAQTHAFLRGFRDLIPAAWVRLFSSNELQKLISGDDTVKGIDVAGLRAAIVYAGGYHPSQPIMQWFWEVLETFTPSQQRLFLKFMTSCSRQPLLGFSALVPAPCIQQIRVQDQDEVGRSESSGNARLPTSSTCMNLLKLPNYPSKDMLREKLLYAIESGAGFELS